VQSQLILATAHTHGSQHDFAWFKEQNPQLHPDGWIVADSGYQGLAKRHPQTCLTRKKPRGGELSLDDKAYNRAVGRFRAPIEHVMRSFKIWRIVVLDKTAPPGPVRKETYRNRRKRFGLRFKLIAGLINAGLHV